MSKSKYQEICDLIPEAKTVLKGITGTSVVGDNFEDTMVAEIALEGAHPAVVHVLKFFACTHLHPKFQDISAPFWALANQVANRCPHNQETAVALRKLLEARDAAVRAAL